MLFDKIQLTEIFNFYQLIIEDNHDFKIMLLNLEDLLKKTKINNNKSFYLEEEIRYKELLLLYQNILSNLNIDLNYKIKINKNLNIFYSNLEYMLILQQNYILNLNKISSNFFFFNRNIDLNYLTYLQKNSYFFKYFYNYKINENVLLFNLNKFKKNSFSSNITKLDSILLILKKSIFKKYNKKTSSFFFIFHQDALFNMFNSFIFFTKKVLCFYFFNNLEISLYKNNMYIKDNFLNSHSFFIKNNKNYFNLINKKKNIYINSNLFFNNLNNQYHFIDFNDILYYNLNKNNLFYENIQKDNIQKNLSKIHFEIYYYLYSAENNFKILLNSFIKKENIIKNNYILTLPINYEKSKILNYIVYNLQSFSIDFFYNNLRFDNILYNPAGSNLKNSYFFLKKNNTTPLFYNYKMFNNFFDYILNDYYNNNISNSSLKKFNNIIYNMDFFRINIKKKIRSFYDSEYYANFLRLQNLDYSFISEIYVKDFRPHLIYKVRPIFLDFFNNFLFNRYKLHHRLDYHPLYIKHLKYPFEKNRFSYTFCNSFLSQSFFTNIDYFYKNIDSFFLNRSTINHKNMFINILNRPSIYRYPFYLKGVETFLFKRYKKDIKFYNTTFYEQTNILRVLNLTNLLFEKKRKNETFLDLIYNILFGFYEDISYSKNNVLYIYFNNLKISNFTNKFLLYRINDPRYNKDLKMIKNLEDINFSQKRFWRKDKIMHKTFYFSKRNKIYPTMYYFGILFRMRSSKLQELGLNNRFEKILFRSDWMYSSINFFNLTKYLKINQNNFFSTYNEIFNIIPFFNFFFENKLKIYNLIKLSQNFFKRNDIISLIKNHYFDIKIFNKPTIFDNNNSNILFEKIGPILIKFKSFFYIKNTQKNEDCLYYKDFLYTPILNKNILSFLPDKYYELYPTLEWNNFNFYNIISRKLLYKHVIFFGDLTNIKILELIYDYIKAIYFFEKLQIIFFNKDIFKNINFYNIKDFIKIKNNINYTLNKDSKNTKVLNLNKNLNNNFLNNELYELKLFFKKLYFNFIFLKNKDFGINYELKKKFFLHPNPINNFSNNFEKNFFFFCFNIRHQNVKVFRKIEINNKYLVLLLKTYYVFEDLFYINSTIRKPFFNFLYYYYNFFILEIYNNFNIFKLDFIILKLLDFVYNKKKINYYLFFNNFNFLENLNLKKKINNSFFSFFKKDNINISNYNLIKKKTYTDFQLYRNTLYENSGYFELDFIDKNILLKNYDKKYLLYNNKRLDLETFYNSDFKSKFFNNGIIYKYNNNLNIFNNFKLLYYLYFKIFNKIITFDIFYFKFFDVCYYSSVFRNMIYSNNLLNFNTNTSIPVSFLNEFYFKTSRMYQRDTHFIRNIKMNFLPFDTLKAIKIIPYIFDNFETKYYELIKNKYYPKKLKHRYAYKHNISLTQGNYIFNRISIEKDRFCLYRKDEQFIKEFFYGIKLPFGARVIGNLNIYNELYYLKKFLSSYNFFNLKSRKIKKIDLRNKINLLSFFSFYTENRFPKNKKNIKWIPFSFRIFNYCSYFENERYSFENRNFFLLEQFYNHKTSSDYLNNLIKFNTPIYDNINIKVRRIRRIIDRETYFRSRAFYRRLYLNSTLYLPKVEFYLFPQIFSILEKDSNLRFNKSLNNLYNVYQIWEIKLSTKIFPYFYGKNFNYKYNSYQYSKLSKKGWVFSQFDGGKYFIIPGTGVIEKLLYRFKSEMTNKPLDKKFYLVDRPCLRIDMGVYKRKYNYFNNKFFFFNNNNYNYIFLKKKYYITSLGNLLFFELNYQKYLNILKNQFISKDFNYFFKYLFKINSLDFNYFFEKNLKYSFFFEDFYSKYKFYFLIKKVEKFPNHLFNNSFMNIYSFNKNNIIYFLLKFFNICLKKNFYIKLPYITKINNIYNFTIYSKFFLELNIKNKLKNNMFIFFDLYITNSKILHILKRIDNFNYYLNNNFIYNTKRYINYLKNNRDSSFYKFFERHSFLNKCINPYKLCLYYEYSNKLNRFLDHKLFLYLDILKDYKIPFFDEDTIPAFSNNLFFDISKEEYISRYSEIISFFDKIYYYNFFKKLKINQNYIYLGDLKLINDLLYENINNKFYFIFSKVYDFNKYQLIYNLNFMNINKNFYNKIFNPYDYFIFRFKKSFTPLNKVYYKVNKNFIFNKIFKNYNFLKINKETFYYFYDFNKRLFSYLNREEKYYGFLRKQNYFKFLKTCFNLKFYQTYSLYNRKKLEKYSFFGFLLKNNIFLGLFELNNLIKISYYLKFDEFYLKNDESLIYSFKNLKNTIFLIKNKYLWLVFYYLNIYLNFIIIIMKYDFFYYLKYFDQIFKKFIFREISIFFFNDFNYFFKNFFKTFILYLLFIFFSLYSWLCVCGEGLFHLEDWILLNSNSIDWNILYNKYDLIKCDVYGRTYSQMQISRFIYFFFFSGFFFLYSKIFIFFFSFIYKLLLLLLYFNKKLLLKYNILDEYLYVNQKKKINNLNLDNNFNQIFKIYLKDLKKKNYTSIFFFKDKHNINFYKSNFIGKLRIPYILDKYSLKRINKLKIISTFYSEYYIQDYFHKSYREIFAYKHETYSFFTKSRFIELGSIMIKGNLKRIIYIYQLSNKIVYDIFKFNVLLKSFYGNDKKFVMLDLKKNNRKNNLNFMNKTLVFNNILKIFLLNPISEKENYFYIPKNIYYFFLKEYFLYYNFSYIKGILFFILYNYMFFGVKNILIYINPNNIYKIILQYQIKNTLVPGDII